MQLRPYQEEILVALREQLKQGKRSIVLYAPTGAGKCLGLDTLVMLTSGAIIKVQDVKVGDRLMGPDGKPRNVLSVTRGFGQLYRIEQVKGDPYVVNADHILSLKTTSVKHGMVMSDGTHIKPGADIVNVNVEVFANSNKTVRHCLKGWKSGAVEFECSQPDLLIDPYWLGLWLGDGRASDVSLCKPECEATRWWVRHAVENGHQVSRYQYGPDDCPEWRIKNNRGDNEFLASLRHYGLLNNKHIPEQFKYASIINRRKLIAGLMDSDGSVDGPRFDWLSVSDSLAQDVAFICRSVGLRVKVTKESKGIKSYGFIGSYWRLSITGDCTNIPTKDKKPTLSKDARRSNVTGISIHDIGWGDYFGFTLDGDKLFLLGDFTVTHNTETAIALLNAARQKNNRSAMILDRIVLVNQTSERLDKYSIDHGVMQSGHWRFRPYEHIQVCSAQTLERRGGAENVQLLIVDECHAVRRQTVEFIRANPQMKVVGLSATPFSKGMGKIYDGIVSTITTKQLVDQKFLVPLRVFISKEIDMTGAKKVAGEWTDAEASDRAIKIVGDVVSEWITKTHEIFNRPVKTIVFSCGVAHGIELSRKFHEQGYNFVCISYRDDDDFKADIIKDFARPDTKIHGLIATDILTKGFDCADVLIAVSARPFSKSLGSHIQQMGRVMRSSPGKEFGVWLCFSGNFIRFREDWDDVYENGVHSLDDSREKPKKEKTEKEKEDSKCPQCSALWERGAKSCAYCGFIRTRASEISSVPGEMQELGAATKEEKQTWWSMCQYKVAIDGWSAGRAAHTYREKFGVWPRGLNDTALLRPDSEFEDFTGTQLRKYLRKVHAIRRKQK